MSLHEHNMPYDQVAVATGFDAQPQPQDGEQLVVIAIIAILIGLLVPAVQ